MNIINVLMYVLVICIVLLVGCKLYFIGEFIINNDTMEVLSSYNIKY